MKKEISKILLIISFLFIVLAPIKVHANIINNDYRKQLVGETKETKETKEQGGCQATLLGDPNDETSLAWIVDRFLSYIRILGPVAMLLFSSIDYVKAVVLGAEDSFKKANKNILTRAGLIILLFLVPTIVNEIIKLFNLAGPSICGLQ